MNICPAQTVSNAVAYAYAGRREVCEDLSGCRCANAAERNDMMVTTLVTRRAAGDTAVITLSLTHQQHVVRVALAVPKSTPSAQR